MAQSPQSPLAHLSPPGSARAQVNERTGADGVRELVLVKHDQRHVFACAPGDESALLERLRHIACDPDSLIDWFDAALISRQLTASLARRPGSRASDAHADPTPDTDSRHPSPPRM